MIRTWIHICLASCSIILMSVAGNSEKESSLGSGKSQECVVVGDSFLENSAKDETSSRRGSRC